jgi:hypothetical protein
MKNILIMIVSMSFANEITNDDELIKNLDFFQNLEVIKESELFFIKDENSNIKNEKSKLVESKTYNQPSEERLK